MYGFSITFLIVFLIFIFISKRFYDYENINLPPIVRYGIDAKCTGNFVKSTNRGQVSEDWFHAKTLILGYNKNNERGRAEASFRFKLPRKKISRSEDTAIELMIEAERIHGGLHSQLGPKQRCAVIEANGEIIDDFWLIQQMPNGEDFGYKDVGPVSIDRNLLTNENLEVTLKIQEDMAWDIDKAIIMIAVLSKRLSVVGSMIAGAVISVIIGLIPVLLEQVILLLGSE